MADKTINHPSIHLSGILRQLEEADFQISNPEADLHTFTDGSSPSNTERFKKLIDGVHFSKRLILSYQLVLLGLLLFFTVIYWRSRFQAWRRKRRRLSSDRRHAFDHEPTALDSKSIGDATVKSRSDISSSSSSSTLGTIHAGISYHPDGVNERSLLLAKSNAPLELSRLQYFHRKIKAWLVYQPHYIPVINKTLPSNGASVAILLFLGLQIFYTLYKIPCSLSMLFVFADRTSLLFVANLPLLYLFAAKNQPIKCLTGYSYEALNILHRRLGEYMCVLAFLHSAGMLGVWYTILRPSGIEFLHFVLMRMILLGFGAFFAYELLYFTSLGTFRIFWYELFLVSHVVLQAAALILVWFHHHGGRPYVGTAVGIFLTDRIVYRLLMRRTMMRASLELRDDKMTAILHANIPIFEEPARLRVFFGAVNVKGGWRATQHVFLTIPPLAPKYLIQAHPFTIYSQGSSLGVRSAPLNLLIRAQNGFTADLVEYARCHKSIEITLEGPYGSPSGLTMLQDSDHAVIVAGGSGVAVAWPLICSLLEVSNNDPDNTSRIKHKRNLLFIWIVREQSHIAWLGDAKLEEIEAKGVTVLTPPPTAVQGHPDTRDMIEGWVSTLPAQQSSSNIGVVASGPDGLNRSVRNICASMIGKGHNVRVEIEKFGW